MQAVARRGVGVFRSGEQVAEVRTRKGDQRIEPVGLGPREA